MDAVQPTLVSMNTKMAAQQPFSWSPMNVNIFRPAEADRGSDSPLDLSLKTRKRCADTTDVCDDDVIFIDQRPAKKRSCYENPKTSLKERTNLPPGQFPNWNCPNGSISHYKNNSVPNQFPSFEDWSRMSKMPPYVSPNVNVSVKNGTNSQLQNNRVSANHSGISRGHQTDKTCALSYPLVKSSNSYSATQVTNVGPLYRSTGYTEHATTSQYSHIVSSTAYCMNQPDFKPNLYTVNHNPMVSKGVTMPSRDKLMAHFTSPPFQMTMPDADRQHLYHPKVPELRAALSSSRRFYPTQGSGGSNNLMPQVPSAQRCSPDSTFHSPSSSNVRIVNSSPCSGGDKLRPKTGPDGLEEKGTTTATTTARSNLSTHQHTPPYTVTRQPFVTGASDVDQCILSKHPKSLSQPTPNTANSGPKYSRNLICENRNSERPFSTAEACLMDTHCKRLSKCDKQAREAPPGDPLHVSVPSDLSTSVEKSVARRWEVESLTRHPKLRCKKHILLSAFSHVEKNLDVTGKTTRQAERPPSPKMPILSPQQHVPPVLPSAFVTEPPPLEPTSQVNRTEDEAVTSTNPGPETLKGGNAFPMYNGCLNEIANSFAAKQTSSVLSENSNAVGSCETNFPTIVNSSVSAETGVTPYAISKQGPLCYSSEKWNKNEMCNPSNMLSPGKTQTTLKEHFDQSLTKSFCCKVIPHEITKPTLTPPHCEIPKNTTATSEMIQSKTSRFDTSYMDTQGDIEPCKPSPRMPAKLIAKLQASGLQTSCGVVETFNDSEDRSKHTDDNSLRATKENVPGKNGTTDSLGTTHSYCKDEGLNGLRFSERKGLDIHNSLQTETFVSGGCAQVTANSVRGSPDQRKSKWMSSFSRQLLRKKPFGFKRKENFPASESPEERRRRHRRSLLDEIANSDGFVTEQSSDRKKKEELDLFADPSLLSREERALQRAMMQFTKLESGLGQKPERKRKPTSNTQQKARQIKRKAMRPSPSKKGVSKRRMRRPSQGKKGFVDFQPEVFETRTRTQTKGIHCVGGYNRDAAYENELMNDDRRKELKRARRRARQMADQRATARQLRREQAMKLKEANIKHPRTTSFKRKVQKKAKEEIVMKSNIEIIGTENNMPEALQRPNLSPGRTKAAESLSDVHELPNLVEETKLGESDGCWKVRGLASTDSVRQNLRSGRQKGGVFMKLSWRPSTCSNKGKPRVAHARVLRSREQAPRSVRMIRLRRRAKLAYEGANNRRETRNSQGSAPRSRASRELPKGRKQCQKRDQRVVVRRQLRNRSLPKRNAPRRGRKPFALEPRKPSRCLRKKKNTKPDKHSAGRYPLRGMTFIEDGDDGNTTEEYDYDVDDSSFASDNDHGDAITRADSAGNGRGFVFPQPPNLRKISVNKNSGETPLHRAARLGYEEVALYWLRTESIDVNSRDKAGFTPLHQSCQADHLPIVRHLLLHGADPNCSSLGGHRPLQFAAEKNNAEIVRLLLAYGADPQVENADSWPDGIVAFVGEYLSDVNGWDATKQEVPWQFYGSAVTESENDVEHNLFTNLPPDEEDEDCDVMFDASPAQQFVSYRLKVPEADRDDNYLILGDVLDNYQMTRTSFFTELGSQIRIFSLSRTSLEEEIANASTICPPLSESAKQRQTIEVIRLSDLPILVSHQSSVVMEEDVRCDQLTRNGNTLKIGSSAVRRRIFQQDHHDPGVISPRSHSLHFRGRCSLRASKTAPSIHRSIDHFLISTDTKNKLRKSLTSTGSAKISSKDLGVTGSDVSSRDVKQVNNLLHKRGNNIENGIHNSLTHTNSDLLCDQFSMDIKNNNTETYVSNGDISIHLDNNKGQFADLPLSLVSLDPGKGQTG